MFWYKWCKWLSLRVINESTIQISEYMWKNGFSYLLTAKFNQDPLKCHFGILHSLSSDDQPSTIDGWYTLLMFKHLRCYYYSVIWGWLLWKPHYGYYSKTCFALYEVPILFSKKDRLERIKMYYDYKVYPEAISTVWKLMFVESKQKLYNMPAVIFIYFNVDFYSNPQLVEGAPSGGRTNKLMKWSHFYSLCIV